jgi:quercetin dioxygenase-like cupin family protein
MSSRNGWSKASANGDRQPEIFPAITLGEGTHNSIEVRIRGDSATLYLRGVSLVTYSPTKTEHLGARLELAREDLDGDLFFHGGFFRKFNIPRPAGPKSGMESIAKAFFKVNGQNHVVLVQYLGEGSTSAEHYHTLEESIAQLAGMSFVELRPVDNDMDYRTVELHQGDILRVPPHTLHWVGTIEGGSLTVAMKQTRPKRKDHLYAPKSDARIAREIESILSAPGYQSGNAIVGELVTYYETLRSSKERRSALIHARYRSEVRSNSSVQAILRPFLDSAGQIDRDPPDVPSA